MAEAKNVKKAGTKLSAAGLLLIAVGTIAVIAAVALLLFYNPDVLQNLLWILLIVIAAIVVIAIVVWIAMALLAIPMYAMRGEQYQENVDYSLDDVESVKEKDSAKEAEEEETADNGDDYPGRI